MRSGLACSLLGAVCLCRCAVFDERMRVGAPPSEDAGGSSGAPVETDASASGDGPTGTRVCGTTVGPGTGVGACPGQGGRPYIGRSEREPNDDPNFETLEPDVLVCGQLEGADNDQFVFAVTSGDCFEIIVELEGELEFHVQGVDTDARHDTSQQLSFLASGSGTFEITIVGNGKGGTYRVLRR